MVPSSAFDSFLIYQCQSHLIKSLDRITSPRTIEINQSMAQKEAQPADSSRVAVHSGERRMDLCVFVVTNVEFDCSFSRVAGMDFIGLSVCVWASAH